MNDLQIEVKALRDDLAAGHITTGDARVWAVEFARIIKRKDPLASLSLGLICLNTCDEDFLTFINGLTEAMLEEEIPNG